ncbi:MAG: hypothetical protein ACE5WD_08120 [Candidatus Aminicenantia bacterium]
MAKKGGSFLVILFILFSFHSLAGTSKQKQLTLSKLSPSQQEEKPKKEEKIYQIEKAEIFKEIYPLISESDRYCSFFILKKPRFDIKIIGSETQKEKIQMSDSDIFYINKGKKDGLQIGDKFLILEVGNSISHPTNGKNLGKLILKRGIAKVVCLDEQTACAEIEKSCSAITIGNFLSPFEEIEGLMGKDLSYEICDLKEKEITGTVVYIQRDYVEAGKNQWVSIDLGTENGMFVGLQMTIYRYLKKNQPRKVIGNLILIDVQPKTSTAKILSCRDAIMAGDRVEPKL